jgi:methyl-accepting chemotaxis protein
MMNYNESLAKIDQRVNESINFMTEMAETDGAFPDEQVALMHDSIRELKQASAQLQTVRRDCADADDPSAYLAQPHIRQIYEVADGLASRVLETAERAEEAVAEYEKSQGPAIV